jgi:hypothetical protein
MLNYLMWRGHGKVEPPAVGAKLDRNEDEGRMYEMITDIGREYEGGSREEVAPWVVQNFYRLLTVSGEKVCDGTDVTVL